MERQMEYAFQSTVEQIYTERAEQQEDKVQREPLEEKAKEAQEIKRKIFGGESITGLPKQEKVDKDDQKSVEETRLLEIASQALNKVAPVMGQDGTEMVVNDGNHIQRAVEVFGKWDVTKAVQLSLQKELADNQAQFEEIENPTDGDREYFKETEEEIKQKHEDALRKIEEAPTKGEPEQISQPIELDTNLPEGFEGQPKVEYDENGNQIIPDNTQSGIKEQQQGEVIPEQVQPEVDVKSQKEALEVEKQNAITQATKPKVELELLGETEEQVIDLISDKASKDKDGGKAKIRQHERIRAKLQALKDLIDCV